MFHTEICIALFQTSKYKAAVYEQEKFSIWKKAHD